MTFAGLWLLPLLLTIAYAYLKLAMCHIKNEQFLWATLNVIMIIATAMAAMVMLASTVTFASMALGIVTICLWHAGAFFGLWSAEKEYEKTFNKPSTVFSFLGRVRDVTKATPEKLRGRVARFRQHKEDKQDVVIVPEAVAMAG